MGSRNQRRRTTCPACHAAIAGAGVAWSAWTCCDAACVARLKRALVQELLPRSAVDREAGRIREAECALCRGPGPNDLYRTKTATGLVLAARLSTERHVCCPACARRRKLAALLHCLAFGWWSPRAALANLVYIPFNAVGAIAVRTEPRPSKDLEGEAMERLADANATGFRRLASNLHPRSGP